MSPKDFTRHRTLTLEHTIGFVLSLSLNRNVDGYDLSSQKYFRDLSQEIGETTDPVRHQSVSEARSKLHWQGFEYLLGEASLEKSKLPKSLKFKGHVTRAVDGTSFITPRTPELLEHFSCRKTNAEEGETHYPYGLCVAAINVFTGQPTHAVVDDYNTSERDLLTKLLPQFGCGDLALLDRGLGGQKVYFEFHERGQFFIHRTKTTGDRVASYIQAFLQSGKKQKKIWITQPDLSTGEKKLMQIRLILGSIDSENKPIVFVTNLTRKQKYPRNEIIKLYQERWTVETLYDRVKNLLNLEKFHARSYNGVMQEIFANLLTLSLAAAATAIVIEEDKMDPEIEKPSMKNAVNVIQRHLFAIINGDLSSLKPKQIREQILIEVRAVKYKIRPGRSYPRVSMQPIQSWNLKKSAKLRAFQEQRKGA